MHFPQLGVNLGADTSGFLMDVAVAPEINVKSGATVLFQLGGPGAGIEANATIYYVGP